MFFFRYKINEKSLFYNLKLKTTHSTKLSIKLKIKLNTKLNTYNTKSDAFRSKSD